MVTSCMDSGVQKPIGLSEAEITAFTDKALFESASVESALARKSEPQKFVWVTNPKAFVRRAIRRYHHNADRCRYWRRYNE